MTTETAALVEVDLDEVLSEDQLREHLSDLETSLTEMTADRDAADLDCDKYVAFVNRLDRAVVVLHDVITTAGIEIREDDISEIIAESLARSKVKADFAAKHEARKAVIELARAE